MSRAEEAEINIPLGAGLSFIPYLKVQMPCALYPTAAAFALEPLYGLISNFSAVKIKQTLRCLYGLYPEPKLEKDRHYGSPIQ